MIDEYKTDQCFNCRYHFRENDMQKIALDSSPIVLFICNSCKANKPKPGKVEAIIGNLKLFI